MCGASIHNLHLVGDVVNIMPASLNCPGLFFFRDTQCALGQSGIGSAMNLSGCEIELMTLTLTAGSLLTNALSCMSCAYSDIFINYM